MNRKAQGFALIDLIFVCGVIGLLASIALPRLLLAKQAAGSASAIGSMRAVNSAELTYALTCGAGFYAPNLSTLGTAPPGQERLCHSGLGDRVRRRTRFVQRARRGTGGPGVQGVGGSVGAREHAVFRHERQWDNLREHDEPSGRHAGSRHSSRRPYALLIQL